MVIIPADAEELDSSYFLTNLHNLDYINWKSVHYNNTKTGEKCCKQNCSCLYCGVFSMNTVSGYSQMQKHLGVDFLCGGCLAFKDSSIKHMNLHIETCEPCCHGQRRRRLSLLHLPKQRRPEGRGRADSN